MERINGSNERFDRLLRIGKHRWLIYYGLFDGEDGKYMYMQQFDHKPSLAEIKALILDTINNDVNERIVSGFVWEAQDGTRYRVWLSIENQQNYKAIYDLAVQMGGQGVLPVTFKFGTTEEPTYHTFETLEELQTFYIQSVRFIQETYQWGWAEKDNIDWSNYEHDIDP